MSENIDARVLIPMKVDAFVLNGKVCSGGQNDAKIAPITQPNYTFLRLDNTLLRNDVLDHTDLHHTSPSNFNSRFTDLGTGETRTNREGVYIHWTIPRVYRGGSMQASNSDEDVSAPSFYEVPTRWIVIRALDMSTVAPEAAQTLIPEVEAWIVESDRQWELDDLDVDVDLQVDVSPFITGGEDVDLEQQAEVFIGQKVSLVEWDGEEGNSVARANLSLLHSSNPLFADYQLHNSNVFSVVDTFDYGDGLKLTSATASYYVIGWHVPHGKDLFYDPPRFHTREELLQEVISLHGKDFFTYKRTREDRLEELNMILKSEDGAEEWKTSEESTRLLCHGAIYEVQWDVDNKPKNVPADNYSAILNEHTPVAVGTTPLDSLITYVAAQRQPSESDKDSEEVQKLEETIFAIRGLLHARDDGVDTRLKASDQVYNWNYSRIDGGSKFQLSGSPGDSNTNNNSTQPSKEDQDKLDSLNKLQNHLNLVRRAQQQIRWTLFSIWWDCITNSTKDDLGYKNAVQQNSNILDELTVLSTTLQELISTGSQELTLKKGADTQFHEQRDPTLLVGGIKSGWPYDFRDKLEVRLDYQTIHPTKDLSKVWKTFIESACEKVPHKLKAAAEALMREFVALAPNSEMASSANLSSSSSISGEEVYPLYHDQGWNPTEDADAPWRDQWGETQPWFPLFMEWEAEYTHIPYDDWTFEEHSARLSQGVIIRGGIKDGITLANEPLDDQRVLSGRTIILPQPGFALETLVSQIIADTPDSVLAEAGVSRSDLTDLRNNLNELAFISSPLSGFHANLATRALGNHVKPNNRISPDELVPIDQAVREDAGLTKEVLQKMLTQTTPTPYGFMIDFAESPHCAFKPAVHGQFKFTKLNIIDKFGQAIHGIDPTPRPRSQGIPPLYPCISDFFEPQVTDSGLANTVVEEDSKDNCRYMQVSPHINQAVRFNSTFVTLDDSNKYWRPVETENPVWGWAVANRADNGLQFFLADGTFYREIRLGGPAGSSEAPRWLPFEMPTSAATTQLDKLLEKFKSPGYLANFAEMIEDALMNLPAVPNSYSESLSAIIGKPLALAYIAGSLELAASPYTNQSSLNGSQEPDSLDDYLWKVKLGDRERAFDGLVAYFNSEGSTENGDDLTLDLHEFYTYYHTTADSKSSQIVSKDPLCPINSSNYPEFKTFWLDPLQYDSTSGSKNLFVDKCKKYKGFGALVDPFTPIHIFSSFFPVQTLQLPSWTWQTAMRKMTTFFQIGPLIIPGDVPGFQQDYSLQSDYKLDDQSKNMLVPGSAVPVSTLKVADWAWLQPYDVPKTPSPAPDEKKTVESQKDSSASSDSAEDESPAFMALGISNLVDGRPRFERGPYTAIEGFLQLRNPLLRQDVTA